MMTPSNEYDHHFNTVYPQQPGKPAQPLHNIREERHMIMAKNVQDEAPIHWGFNSPSLKPEPG